MPTYSIQSRTGSLLVGVATLLLAYFSAAETPAAGQAEQFFEALRQKGWNDTALEYLAIAADDPIATPEFVASIAYQRGKTLASLAKQAGSERKRQKLTKSAVASLLSYAKENQDAPLQLDALHQVGNLLSNQALHRIAKAKKLPAAATTQREQLFKEARTDFEQAVSVVSQVLKICEERIRALPKAAVANRGPTSVQSRLNRKQLADKQAKSRFLIATIGFEKAQTYTKGSPEYRQAFEAAANDFSQIYNDYPEGIVGFYSRFREGRCYQESSQLEKALECYEDLIDRQIPDPRFRRLVARAFRRQAECHLAMGKPDLVISECRQALGNVRGKKRQQAEWLAVAYRLAEAYIEKAKTLGSNNSGAKRLRTEARQLLRDVVRQPGEFQSKARGALASLGGSSEAVPENFAGTLAAGKLALDAMNSTKLAVQLAKNNNPEGIESLELQFRQNKKSALQYFQQALQLTDDQTSSDELNSVRYYLCWLFWEDGRLEEAAIMGEFLARRYPSGKHAPVAAKVALAAYERLYNNAKTADTEDRFTSQRLTNLAKWIAAQSPDSPEASTAISLMINIALREDRIADAEQLLVQLPEQSRDMAAASLGKGLWTRYLRRSAGGKTPDTDLAKLRDRAATMLSKAFDAIAARSGKPSLSEATAVLYFAQLLLAEGDASRAVEVLEHPSAGPLSLLQKGALAGSPQFSVETYKAALRAYVLMTPPQMEEAQQVMDALEQAVGTEDSDQKKLTRIYVSLGRQLQRQVKELTQQRQAAKARVVADAFGDLLERVASQKGSANWATSSWIAQTNLQLGQGLRGDDATTYFERAEKAYRLLLESAEKDASFAPSPIAILATQKRLGDCLRAMGRYDQAFEQYQAALAKKPSLFELQHAAAMTLQQWGEKEKNLGKLEQAIRGALPQANGKNLVWGWLRLASVADYAKKKTEQSSADEATRSRIAAKHLDLFFESRYNASRARFLTAKCVSKSTKAKHLRTAKTSVASMLQLYPNMGDTNWKQAFEKLKKEIQAAG